jgi:uncharacterized membrane protein YoaK (UPF0700 family)
MSFQAGYVNVGGFYTSGNFVSHVTGTSSQIGRGLAAFDYTMLLTFLTILIAFIAGAAFAGFHIGRALELKKDPNYILVLAVKSFFFGLIFILSGEAISPLSGYPQETLNILIIFLLSFCCGVQNSTCAISTNGFLKPTHMTGLSTDIGIFFSKLLAWKKNDHTKFKEERKKNRLRVGILASFIFGGAIAAMIFNFNGHYGFLFPFISSMCFLILGILQDIKKISSDGILIRSAKNSILATFLITLFFGVEAYIKTTVDLSNSARSSSTEIIKDNYKIRSSGLIKTE